MLIREPAQAGCFYSGEAAACRREVAACVAEGVRAVEGCVLGGIVPHAGWKYSGKVAGAVFATVAANVQPTTVVIFGAVHRHRGRQAALFPAGCWETPLGPVAVDGRLGERVLGNTNLIVEDAYAHEEEHSIEVQIPFIQHLWPEAMILPILVPPTDEAGAVGEAVARVVQSYHVPAVMIGSTDLTHYGPSYGYTPHGAGAEGLRWAKETNDRRMLDVIAALRPEAVVPESRAHQNACGAGAVAATLAAVRECGAERAVLLEHTTSGEVVRASGAGNSVGYAGLVFTGPATPAAS